ncbi:hypothetical protein N431DRAFT_334431, partial [Stipitochalara longipes BDJ]
SGILSIINRETNDKISNDRPTYTSAPTMAAAVVSPSSMYSGGPPPPYSSGWSGPTGHSMSGLISPPDSRRTSDNKAEPPPPIQTSQPHRQSLPSIHEALSNGPKSNPYASPVSASLPTSHQLPYSQSQAPSIPRSYPPADHAPYPTQLTPSQPRQPSPPQPVHPQASAFSRPEPGPGSYAEAPRHPSLTSLQAAPAPHNPYAAPTPRYEPARYEPDPRAPERAPNGYAPAQQPPSYVYGPAPTQLPPSGYQGPPPPPNQPRYYPQDRRESEGWKEGEKAEVGGPFKVGLKRRLDVWDFEMNLSEISLMSTSISEWSQHYNAIAQEQQRSANAIPDRMPSLESLNEMISNQTRIGECLKNMQHMMIQQRKDMEETQYMREQGVRGPGSYDEEMSMYGDDMKNHGFGPEGKKRRGRAAPPGRCHSCNRAETPEWRRGPDGARTLCNACGLHYAKLTRKNTMKQSQGSNGSSLRPKSMDEVSPRPL